MIALPIIMFGSAPVCLVRPHAQKAGHGGLVGK